MKMTLDELARIGVPCEHGREFESEMLDVLRARFRIVGVTARGAEVVRLRWVKAFAPPRSQRPGLAKTSWVSVGGTLRTVVSIAARPASGGSAIGRSHGTQPTPTRAQ